MAASSQQDSKRPSAFEIIGSSVGSARHHRKGVHSTIEVKDIIESGQRYANKIGSTFVPTLQKPMTYTFQKDSGKRDFVSAVTRANSTKLAPNQYKIVDSNGFISKENPKQIRFAFSKDQKMSILEQSAKKKAWVPSPNNYSPEAKRKTLGNYTW